MKLSPTAVWAQTLVGYLCGAASSCGDLKHTGAPKCVRVLEEPL
jgi:hypothetical protein